MSSSWERQIPRMLQEAQEILKDHGLPVDFYSIVDLKLTKDPPSDNSIVLAACNIVIFEHYLRQDMEKQRVDGVAQQMWNLCEAQLLMYLSYIIPEWQGRPPLSNDELNATLRAGPKGLRHAEKQSEKGKKGAGKRWGNNARGEVNNLIEKLQGPAYEDWKAKEKWDELFSLMQDIRLDDGDRLDPKETWNKQGRDKSRIDYNGGHINYKTFKNRLCGDTKTSR